MAMKTCEVLKTSQVYPPKPTLKLQVINLLQPSLKLWLVKLLQPSLGLWLVNLLLLTVPACSQPNFTANDIVPPMPGTFDYGSNMGFFPPNYGDKALAALAQEYGATSIRPGLFHHFLDYWGYDSRKEHFQYYDSIGLRNVMAIIGFPSETARDPAFYCPNERSEMFDDLYKPIWDNGENGTPVNDANPYALYVWKIATTYKGLIKTYEAVSYTHLCHKRSPERGACTAPASKASSLLDICFQFFDRLGNVASSSSRLAKKSSRSLISLRFLFIHHIVHLSLIHI